MGALRRTLVKLLGKVRGKAEAEKIGRIVGGILKGLGVKKGAPDALIFDIPPDYLLHTGLPPRGVAIELKTPTGRATPAQLDMLEALHQLGWLTRVCKGADAAINWLEHLGYNQRWPAHGRY